MYMTRCRLLLLAFTIVISSCGGGGGNDTPEKSQTVSVTKADGVSRILSVKADLAVSADCYIGGNDFTVLAGDLSPSTESCGKFLGYSNAALGSYSIGRFEYAHDVSDQVSIEVIQKKIIGNISRPIEVYFLGGAFGWAFNGSQAYYYLYESETHWTGWIATSQINPEVQNKVSIHQSGKTIIVYVNGNELDQFELQSNVTAKRVSIFFKGDPGVRETMAFDQFLVLDRNASSASQAENAAVSTAQFESTDLKSVVKSGSVDLGDLGGDSISVPIRRLVLKNSGSTDIESPSIITDASSGATEIAVPSANACSVMGRLQPGASCSVYVRPVADQEYAALNSAPTEVPLGVTSGTNMKALAVKVQATPSAKTPKITSVIPSVAQAGVRTRFTVIGTDLPATLALKIDASICENSSKPASNQIFCTPTVTSSGRLIVMSDNTSLAKQLTAKIISISNPGNYYLPPLDSQYIKSTNITLELGDYNSSVKRYHTGIDIMTKGANPSVLAIADGEIVWNSTSSTKYKSDYDKYFNAFVIVKHGDFYAYYGHLASSLKVGDKVVAGRVIGSVRDGYNMNSTINTNLNHLHLSISKGSSWQTSGWGYKATKEQAIALFVNPMKYAGL